MKTRVTLLISLLTLFFAVKAQQPENGGFDVWTHPANPDGWITINDLVGLTSGVFASQDNVDKVSGVSSLQMIADTIPGSSQYGVIFGLASLGTGTLGANGPSLQGVPFTARPDTLSFDYKHSSVSSADTGRIQMFLTAGTVQVLLVNYLLTDQAGWTHVAIPLTALYANNSTPDTLGLQIQTSGGTGGQAKMGTELHVDNVHFGYVTRAPAPSGVYTLGSDAIGSYNFNLYGAINTSDSAAVYSFVYSTDSTFATSTTTATQNLTDDSLEVIWAKVSGLSPATNYFYYVQDSTSTGVVKGDIMKFYTDTISYFFTNSGGADVYGNNYAVMNGAVHGLQSSTAISFIWGLSPGNLDSTTATTPATVTDSNSYYFQGTPNNLTPGATYFYRLVGITATDTIYSDIRAFYLGSPWTTYVALPPTNITATSVTISTNVQGFPVPIRIAAELDNNVLQTYFHYHPAYYDFTTSVIDFSYNATGLQPNQYYGTRFGVQTWIGNYYADTAFTTLATGIKEVAGQNNDVTVYPNPANNNLTVELKGNTGELMTAQLFSLNGQVVNEFEIPASQNKATLYVNELEPGVYILKLVSGDVFYTSKVTIVK